MDKEPKRGLDFFIPLEGQSSIIERSSRLSEIFSETSSFKGAGRGRKHISSSESFTILHFSTGKFLGTHSDCFKHGEGSLF